MEKLEKFLAWNLTKVQNYRHDVRCDVGETQITGTLMERSVGCVDWFHKIHFFEWKATRWMFMVRAETDEKTNDLKGLTNYGPKCGNLCLTHQNVKRNKWAIEKPKLDNDRRIRGIYFIDPEDGKFKDIMNKVCQQQCLVKLHCAEVAGKPAALLEDTRQRRLYCWSWRIYENSNGRSSSQTSWRSHCRKRCEFHESPQPSAQIYVLRLKQWKTRCKGSSGKIIRKNPEKIPTWQLTKVKNKNEVIAEARNEGRTVHFASLMDLCHLKNSELEPKFQKYKGRVVLRGDTVKSFRIVCSIYWARIISITNDGCKRNGYYIKTTWMRRIRSRRSISLHPAQNGRCTDVTENSKVRMSRYLDTSTETQMAKIMVQYGRPSRYSWAKSVRSSFGRTVLGFEKILLKHGWEKVSKLGILFRTPWKRSVYVEDIKLGGKKPQRWPNVEDTDERSWFGRTDIIPCPCLLGCTQRKYVKETKDIVDNYIQIQDFGRSYGKTTSFREIGCAYFFVVFWHGW